MTKINKTGSYPSGKRFKLTQNEIDSFNLRGFSTANAMHLAANAETQEGRDWWALYYYRMSGSLAPVPSEALADAVASE